MSTVHGVYKNGQIILHQPADWPDGAEVRVELAEQPRSEGLRDEDWPTTPEGIAALLARIDAWEAVQRTDEEIADWEKSRREQAELAKKRFDDLERMFE